MSKKRKAGSRAGRFLNRNTKKAARLLWGNTKERDYLRTGLRKHRISERLTKL